MISRLLTRARPPDVHPVAPVLPWLTDEYLPAVVTEAEALDLPPVSASLEMTCALIMQMPLRALDMSGQPVEPAPPILRAPVPGSSVHEWICAVVRDLALCGNSLAVLGDPAWDGWPSAIYPVPWPQWSVRPDGSYQIGQEIYQADQVMHLKRNMRTGEQLGRGLLQTYPRLLSAAIAAERFARDYFAAGASPSTVVTHPDPELTQERAELLKARFRIAARRREAVVVPTGTLITPLVSNADDAQLAESRKWNSQQLALAMSTPPALLGLDAGGGLTYRNVQQVFQQWIVTTVMGLLVPVEQALSMQCLPRTLMARFDTTAILRPAWEERVDLAVKGLQGDVFTRDEARAVVDLPPGAPVADPMAIEDAGTVLELVPAEEMTP